MKRSGILKAWLVFSFLLSGLLHSQVVDGIYVTSYDQALPSVLAQNGRTYQIGERLDISSAEVSLHSNTNANDSFYLRLKFPYDPSLREKQYLLVLDECGYYISGGGGTRDVHTDISATIDGVEAKDAIAQYFDCPVTYKKHPGHQLLVSFESDKKVYALGEEIVVTLKLTNVGQKPVAFMKGGRNRAARNTQFLFSGFHGLDQPLIDIGTNQNWGGFASPVTLQPGEVFEDEVNLSKWFELSQPGYYSIHASYFLEFVEPSNADLEFIWQDYVSGDFMFSVAE